jgi:hypothetical protein
VASQYDIVENRNLAGRSLYPFLLILQSDQAATTDSVIVAPLVHSSVSPKSRERLHLTIDVDGHSHVAIIEDLAAVSRRQLGRIVGSASDSRYEITRALDMLFTGV